MFARSQCFVASYNYPRCLHGNRLVILIFHGIHTIYLHCYTCETNMIHFQPGLIFWQHKEFIQYNHVRYYSMLYHNVPYLTCAHHSKVIRKVTYQFIC